MQSYVYKKVTELTLLIKLNIENLKKNINPINTKIAIIETSQLVCSGNNWLVSIIMETMNLN